MIRIDAYQQDEKIQTTGDKDKKRPSPDKTKNKTVTGKKKDKIRISQDLTITS